MRVKDVMVGTPASCRPEMNLGEAVEILWNRNCGILPVVDEFGKVTAVVTDRDICIALGTRNQLACELKVGDVASRSVYTCKATDDIRAALGTMSREKVRRLPVVSVEGELEGILSMDDVVFHAESKGTRRTEDLSPDDVVKTLKRLYLAELPDFIASKRPVA